MTRRKTFSGGSQATFNFGCQSELHDFATSRDGSGSPTGDFLFPVQDKIPAFRVEPPDAVRVGRDLQDVAGIPAGHLDF